MENAPRADSTKDCAGPFTAALVPMGRNIRKTPGLSDCYSVVHTGKVGCSISRLIASGAHDICSMGVALSTSLPALMVCRVIQASGCGCMIAVGASTVADIYHPRERGG